MKMTITHSVPLLPAYSQHGFLLLKVLARLTPDATNMGVQLAGYFGTKFLLFPRLAAQIRDISSCMIMLIVVNAR